MSIELTQAETNTASIDPMLATEIKPRPLSYSLNDYHLAGVPGSVLHAQWQDKPHRLLYDLIAAVAYYAGKQPAQATQPAEVTRDEVMQAAKKATAPEWQDVIDGWHMGLDLMAFARTILALRPVQVPMTTTQIEQDLWPSLRNHGASLSLYDCICVVRAAEARLGITAQAKKEGV